MIINKNLIYGWIVIIIGLTITIIGSDVYDENPSFLCGAIVALLIVHGSHHIAEGVAP